MKTYYLPMTADLFHIGHLRAIRRCSQEGKVIIGLLTDEAIEGYKGRRPIISFEERQEILAAIKEVAEVVRQDSLSPYENLKKYQVDFLVSGDGFEPDELEAARLAGCATFDIPYTQCQSTTLIKEKIKKMFNESA